uniref:Uncharacterized protein n=1 Tax=Ixodes ricinus TaxID=34613 RepID=A0A6B0UJX0_IXORI
MFFFFLASVFFFFVFFPAFRKLFCLPTLPMLSQPRCTRIEKCVHFEGFSLLFLKCDKRRGQDLYYVRLAWARASLLFFLISHLLARGARPWNQTVSCEERKKAPLCFFLFS